MKAAPFLLALLCLSGCSAEATPAAVENSTSPAVVESPVVVESPSAVPAPTSTPVASVITTVGFGPLIIGEPVPAENGLVGWDADFCSPGVGGWVPIGRNRTDFFVVTDGPGIDSVVTRLIFAAEDIETKSGAHTGLTADQLTSIYPGVESGPAPGTDGSIQLFTVADDGTKVQFVAVHDITDDGRGAVQFIDVLADDDSYFSAEDSPTGACDS